MKIQATIEATGANTTGIELSADHLEKLGGGKRIPVTVTINGHRYETTVGSMGGRSLISLSAANRAAAGVSAGDVVSVTVERNETKREIAVPPALQVALDGDAEARQAFEALSNSKKQRLTLPIENAKTDATRQRNVDKALASLRSGA